MDESVLFVSYIDECRVETRHDFAYLAQINISYGEARSALLFGKFGQHLVFAQGDGDFSRVYVYD